MGAGGGDVGGRRAGGAASAACQVLVRSVRPSVGALPPRPKHKGLAHGAPLAPLHPMQSPLQVRWLLAPPRALLLLPSAYPHVVLAGITDQLRIKLAAQLGTQILCAGVAGGGNMIARRQGVAAAAACLPACLPASLPASLPLGICLSISQQEGFHHTAATGPAAHPRRRMTGGSWRGPAALEVPQTGPAPADPSVKDRR